MRWNPKPRPIKIVLCCECRHFGVGSYCRHPAIGKALSSNEREHGKLCGRRAKLFEPRNEPER